MPGPNFGYSNSSMSEVTSVALPFFMKGTQSGTASTSALMPAVQSERFLMRCAAQSAWISLAGTPQTFSLYVLKK
ncbi:unannotated protein [freshwater metagenome]|uniref:Unannotated protein n=1 Tax=freshwater metagenome TaxID=449393 RepID=A0A6J6GTJ8_9ZZZZ